MKTKFECMISVVVSMTMVVTMLMFFPEKELKVNATGVSTYSELVTRLNSLMDTYVGTKWNGTYAGSTQCKGFASMIFNELFDLGGASIGTGSVSSNSTNYMLNDLNSNVERVGTVYDGSTADIQNLISQAKPGDFLQVRRRSSGGPHSMIVVSASSTGVEIFDCNADGKLTVQHYSQSFSTFNSKNIGVSLYRSKNHPNDDSSTSSSSSSSPNLCVDSVTGGIGTITISGWAFDPDNKDASLAIHVYMDGDKWVGATTANQADDDGLKAVIGSASSYNHRFSVTFYTSKTGNHSVNIAALDTGDDGVSWSSGHEITITADEISPTVTEVEIINVTSNGYTIRCKASDNVMVDHVNVATWSENLGQDADCQWSEMTRNGDYYICTINFSNHQNQKGTYQNHIYAYDVSGNHGFGAEAITLNCNLGDNFDATITSKASSKYIICAYDGNVKLYDTSGDCYASKRIWNFTRNSDGSYRITSYWNNECLDVDGAVDDNGANIQTYEPNDSDAQKWFIIKIGNNYNIKPSCSNEKVLDITEGLSDNGTNVQLYEKNSSNAQTLNINKINDTTAPTISNVEISNVSLTGYKVTITTLDNIGIKSVQVPTWTSSNGQDDLIWHKAKQTSQNTWTYTVNISDHNSEYGTYYTDVYVTDFGGNQDKWSAETNHRKTIKVGVYTVTFNANGGSCSKSTQDVTYNSTYGALPTPTRTGYTFIGWYTTKSNGTKITASTKVAIKENQTLYAQWKANPTGDINDDGNITYIDLNMFKKHILGISSLTVTTTTTDINNDGILNIIDFILLKQKLFK